MSFSVVTPSFNQAQFISRTIESVVGQKMAGLEYVIIDACSSDGTVEILKTLPETVRWISEPDRGQAHGVNKGLAATSGEYIGWLNSDDVYYPGALAQVESYLSARPEIDVVYGRADHIDADGRVLEAYPTEEFDAERLRGTCFICQPAAFIRRRCLDRWGLLDEQLHYCMDYEYWLRLAAHGARFAYIDAKLAGSRLHAETKTLRARAAVNREVNDVFRRMFARVPDPWIENYAHIIVGNRIDRRLHPASFSIAVNAATVLSSLWWNRGISGDLRSTIASRVRHALLGRR